MGFLAATTLTDSAGTLAASLILVPPLGILGAAYATLFGTVLASVLTLILVARARKGTHFAVLGLPNRRTLHAIIKYSLPIFASGFVTLPAWWIAETDLAVSVSFADVGLYRLGKGFYSILVTLPSVISIPLMPLFAEMRERDRVQVNVVFLHMMRIVLLATLPLAVGAALASHFIVVLLYGESYAGAGVITAILVLSALFFVLSPITSSLLLGAGRSLSVFWLDVAWAVIFVPLAILFIRFGGLVGIGYAVLLAGFGFLLVELAYLGRYLSISVRALGMPLVLAGVSMATTLALQQFLPSGQTLLLAIPLAAGVAVVGFQILQPEERRMLVRSLRDLVAQ